MVIFTSLAQTICVCAWGKKSLPFGSTCIKIFSTASSPKIFLRLDEDRRMPDFIGNKAAESLFNDKIEETDAGTDEMIKRDDGPGKERNYILYKRLQLKAAFHACGAKKYAKNWKAYEKYRDKEEKRFRSDYNTRRDEESEKVRREVRAEGYMLDPEPVMFPDFADEEDRKKFVFILGEYEWFTERRIELDCGPGKRDNHKYYRHQQIANALRESGTRESVLYEYNEWWSEYRLELRDATYNVHRDEESEEVMKQVHAEHAVLAKKLASSTKKKNKKKKK